MILSKRLTNCLHFTSGFNKLADIGTDHAFLPIQAIKEGYVSKALAIDNKEGPFVIAYSNVKKHGLQDSITVIKGDGIEKIDDEVDVVVISGMGGNLIRKILLEHSLRNVKRIILQPNSDSDQIRTILSEIGFKIIEEVILMDNKKFYDIIVLERGQQKLNTLEELFGPINLQDKSYFFTLRIKKEMDSLNRVLQQVTAKEDIIRIKARLELLKEALS